MVTILLEKILTLLTGWLEAFTTHAGNVLAKLNLIEEDTDAIVSNTSDIAEDTEDIKDNTASIITPINNISGNTSSIKTNTDSIKADTTIIKNNINTISTNTGSTSAFCEDIANNTLDCSNRLVTIGSDTTQLRSNSNTVLSDLDKVYEALKWTLVDKVTTETVEGTDTVSFDTDLTNDLVELEVGIEPTQSGSGIPSPDNVRPIIGITDKSIIANGNNITIALGQTVYGGVLDVTRGKLTVTHGFKDLGSLFYTRATSYGNAFFYGALTAKAYSSCKCGIYEGINATYASNFGNNALNYQCACSVSGTQIFIRNDDYTDATAFKTAMSGVMLVYELATPIEIQLTPSQIATIKGINSISSEGTIKVTYEETVKHYLDKQQ